MQIHWGKEAFSACTCPVHSVSSPSFYRVSGNVLIKPLKLYNKTFFHSEEGGQKPPKI